VLWGSRGRFENIVSSHRSSRLENIVNATLRLLAAGKAIAIPLIPITTISTVFTAPGTATVVTEIATVTSTVPSTIIRSTTTGSSIVELIIVHAVFSEAWAAPITKISGYIIRVSSHRCSKARILGWRAHVIVTAAISTTTKLFSLKVFAFSFHCGSSKPRMLYFWWPICFSGRCKARVLDRWRSTGLHEFTLSTISICSCSKTRMLDFWRTVCLGSCRKARVLNRKRPTVVSVTSTFF
jgi:hypothetical protein